MALTSQQRAKLKSAGYSDELISAYEFRKEKQGSQQQTTPTLSAPTMPAPPPLNVMSLPQDVQAKVQANPQAFNEYFETRNLAKPENFLTKLARGFSGAVPTVTEAAGSLVMGPGGAGLGRFGGEGLSNLTQNVAGIQDEGNLEQVQNMGKNAAIAAGSDWAGSKILKGIGKIASPVTSRVSNFVGERLPQFLLKGNSLFRETGKKGEQATMRSIESQIPELAENVPKAGRELSEEVFDRIDQMAPSGNKIAVNARKAVAAEVPGSLENIVQQEVKNIKTPVPDLKKYVMEAVKETQQSYPGRAKQIQEAADNLLTDNTFGANTWEKFRNIRAGLDRETGGIVTEGGAIDKQLRSRIANLMRDELSNQSEVIKQVMPELHFNYRLLNSAAKQGKKSSIPSRITDTLLANPILIPMVQGLKGLPETTLSVGGPMAQFGTRSVLENLFSQFDPGNEQESLYPRQ